MIKKKICILGPFGVGKTSLIRKYVFNIYSDAYLSTVGVKIDKRLVTLDDGQELTLMIWDLEGRDDYRVVADTYLRGMSGYIMVADGTRMDTLTSVKEIRKTMVDLFPELPAVFLLNKADLVDRWSASDEEAAAVVAEELPTLRTSAKTGEGVEEAFAAISRMMLGAANG